MSKGYHILVCNSYRANGAPQGVCNRKGGPALIQQLEQEIGDRGLDATVTATGCLQRCEKGPLMVVYPPGWWYGQLDEGRIETILDALENDAPAEALLLP